LAFSLYDGKFILTLAYVHNKKTKRNLSVEGYEIKITVEIETKKTEIILDELN